MPEGNTPPADGQTGTPPAAGTTGTPPAAPEKTFTQADLDYIVQERLQREGAKFADYADLKAKAEAFDKAKDAERSELEKAQAKAEAAEKRAQEADARTAATNRRSAIIAAAAKAGAADPSDLIAILAGDETIVVDGDEVKGVDEAVKKVLEKKPYLKAGPSAGTKSGAEFPGTDPKSYDQKIADAEKAGDTQLSTRLKLEKFQLTQQQ